MPEWVRYGLVCLIVLLTHFQEGITGFGCVALGLPFVTLLLGLDAAVPVLTIPGWFLAVLIVLESRKHKAWGCLDHNHVVRIPGASIEFSFNEIWREFWLICIFVGIGMPFGIVGARVLPEATLKWVLAGFMVAIGTNGLVNQLRGVTPPAKIAPRVRLLTGALMPISGVIHGAFAAGGPLLVVYATRAITDKTLFRVTLCMVWIVLNGVLVAQWMMSGRLTPQIWRISALCMPFMLIGLFLGNRAHYRINENTFRKVVYSVLIASGVFLVWSLLS